MNDYNLQSTYLRVFTQEQNATTMKGISSSILPGESTDANTGISIFNLPIEIFEKGFKDEKRKDKQGGEEINIL